MSPKDVLIYSFEALKERKLRAALTILMVIVGGALITSLNGMGRGFSIFIEEQLSNLAPNVLIVTPAMEFEPFMGVSRPKTSITDMTVRILGSLPGVLEAVPYYRGSVVATSGGRSVSATLSGIDQTRLPLINPNIELAKGEFVGPRDPTGALLGSNVAKLESKSPFADVGWTIKIEYLTSEGEKAVKITRSFIVKGVLEPTGNVITDNSIYVSPQVANSLLRGGGKYTGVFVISGDESLNDSISDAIKERYGENLEVMSPRDILATIESVVGGVRAFIFSVGSVSLIVGAIGIVATLFTSVMERVREIGTLKAIGFSNLHISTIFLSEALIIGVLGGLLGILGGIGGSYLLTTFVDIGGIRIRPAIDPMDLVSVFFTVTGLSVIAGIYPAWRAARLDPVIALRKE